MKVLFVSFHFAPYNAIGAVRITKFAKYFESFGHEVRVLTAGPQSTRPTLPVEIPEDHVLRTPWLDLHQPAEIAGGGRSAVQRDGDYRLSAVMAGLRRFVWPIYKAVVAVPDFWIGWLPHALRHGASLIRRWRPDVIIASGPPFTAAVIGATLARRFEIPFLVEFRDPWVDNQIYPFGPLRRSIDRRLESWVVRGSMGFVTVSQGFQQTILRSYSVPSVVITNGFEACEMLDRAGAETERLIMNFTGSVYGHYDPEPILAFLSQAEALRERVLLRFFGFGLGRVRDQVAALGLEDCVETHPPVDHAEALQIQRDADVNLLLLWNDPEQPGHIPGKLFEYLAARRPILAVGSNTGEAAQIILEREAGRVVSTTSELKQAIEFYLAEKARGSIADLPASASDGFDRQSQATALEAFARSRVEAFRREPMVPTAKR